jgi:CxxC motif-containing protein
MSNLNIYQIEKEYLELANQLIESGGEVSPELELQLTINQEQLEQKARGYGFVVKQMESDVSIIDAEIERLKGLKNSRLKTIERLETTVSNAMQLYQINRLETPTLKISFRKSESVEIDNEADIPAQFLKEKITYTIDKTAIKEAIKKGEVVIGARLQQNQNIQIK